MFLYKIMEEKSCMLLRIYYDVTLAANDVATDIHDSIESFL